MKILLLSGASSIHTIRWANGLVAAGCDVLLVTQQPLCQEIDARVQLRKLPMLGAAGYYLHPWKLRQIVKQFQPDIVNAHYASGYGTLSRLAGCHPVLLNVWGSDVYDFPQKSGMHKKIIIKNLRAADAVASTSRCMLEETRKYLPPAAKTHVIPFGVDTQNFEVGRVRDNGKNSEIVIGTVKKLEHKYGIDTLLHAFKILFDWFTEQRESGSLPNLILRIVGYGRDEAKLKDLAAELGIRDHVVFVGKVANEAVPGELAKMDIFAALSRLNSESFGVSVVEAGAAGLPSVVSDVDGFKEVVIHKKTGIIVPREDPRATAEALKELITSPELMNTLGLDAEEHVKKRYEWQRNVEEMIAIYQDTIQAYAN